MTAAGYARALAACLGLGAVDVAVLNLWLLPAVVGASAPQARVNSAPAAKAEPVAVARSVSASPTPTPTPTPTQTPTPTLAPTQTPTPVSAPAVVLSFDRGSWRVGNRATYAIERTAAELRGVVGQIEVAGHADARGSDELNQTLSERRARAVARRLEQAGIVAARIAVTAFGSRRPSGTGNDRRVEVYVRGSP